jgi:hypothetical protein
MTTRAAAAVFTGDDGVARPPFWLVAATGVLALGTMAMAVAETSLWMHYLIDAGESISLVGLGFMLVAGVYLYTRGRLLVSLPLALPWLLFPVITQGDQIIDHLSINWMRLITHVLLAALFGFPVAVIVMAVRYAFPVRPSPPSRWLALVPGLAQLRAGHVREGSALLAALLFVLEMWVAVQFLGVLMVITLIVMTWAVLAYGFAPAATGAATTATRRRSERFALGVLIAGVIVSLGLFVGYKNRPGAYQGSPSYYMDPTQREAGFELNRIAVPPQPPVAPADPALVRRALTTYARAFEKLLGGYYILDRNYNYDFHNRLFLRSTPLLANYRAVGLSEVASAEALREEADALAAPAISAIAPGDPLAALFEDVRAYARFTFDRAPVLEHMSAGFEQTQAGLQHATHLYEGEGKVLGVRLVEILDKHRAVLASPVAAPIAGEFVTISRAVHGAYANRIVGF